MKRRIKCWDDVSKECEEDKGELKIIEGWSRRVYLEKVRRKDRRKARKGRKKVQVERSQGQKSLRRLREKRVEEGEGGKMLRRIESVKNLIRWKEGIYVKSAASAKRC